MVIEAPATATARPSLRGRYRVAKHKQPEQFRVRLRIAEVAQERGFQTVSDLHYESKVGYNTLYRLWNNVDGIDPHLSTLERIAQTLRVPVQDLIDRAECAA